MARRLSQLAKLPVTELTGVGPKVAEGLADAFAVETVLDLLTHYPRRYIDRTNEARIRDLASARRPWCWRRSSARRPAHPGPAAAALVTVDVTDGSGHLQGHVLQPGAGASASCRPGTEAVALRQARALPGPQADDEPGRRPASATAPAASSRSTRSPRRRGSPRGRSATGGRGARPGRASFAEPLPDWVLRPLDLVDRARAFRRHPRSPSRWPTRQRRPPAAGVRRAAPRPAGARPAQAGARARRPRASRTRIDGDAGRRGSTTACRSRSPARSGGRSPRSSADLAGPAPHAPPAAGRRRRGQDGRRRLSALLVAVQGGHQGALMAPTEVLAEQHHLGIRAPARRASRSPTRATCSASGRSRVELLTNRTTRRRAPAHRRPGWPTATVDIVIGTHALIQERRRVPRRSAWSSSTSSTASASSSAPRCARRAPARPCPTCW